MPVWGDSGLASQQLVARPACGLLLVFRDFRISEIAAATARHRAVCTTLWVTANASGCLNSWPDTEQVSTQLSSPTRKAHALTGRDSCSQVPLHLFFSLLFFPAGFSCSTRYLGPFFSGQLSRSRAAA